MFRHFSETFTSPSLPDVVASRAANAATAVPLLLIPAIAVIIAFRLPPARCGLRPRYLATGLVVTGIRATATRLAVIAGRPFDAGVPLLADQFWSVSTIGSTAVILALQSLINGIPEELIYRGVITGRLLPWLGRPGNALVASTLLFNASHIPAHIAAGQPRWQVAAQCVIGGFNGITWAYLWYRTQSIWPGAIWHTATTVIAPMFPL